MSAAAHQQNGYLSATKSLGSPRTIEYQVFSKVTGRLNRSLLPDAAFAELAEALQENLALWRTLALEVIDSDNELTAQLRSQLFYLFEFTNSHSSKVLRGEADAQPLIDINTSIMKGLRGVPQDRGTQ